MKSIIARKNWIGKYIGRNEFTAQYSRLIINRWGGGWTFHNRYAHTHKKRCIFSLHFYIFLRNGMLSIGLCSAETLLSGLEVEKTRWSDIASALRKSLVNVIGDVLLSSGFIAYLGCFPAMVSTHTHFFSALYFGRSCSCHLDLEFACRARFFLLVVFVVEHVIAFAITRICYFHSVSSFHPPPGVIWSCLLSLDVQTHSIA